MSGYDVVVIGASWGGLHALERILGALGDDFPTPIVVAQHRDPDADDELLTGLLNRHTALCVADAEDKSPLEPGNVLIAPPGYHVLLDDGAAELSVDEPVQFARPSIDVLFESAADAYGGRAVGVLLTGANEDGAHGLCVIAERGGYTIVQDPATCVRQEMPKAALAVMEPDAVVRLDDIPAHLGRLCR
ncbi:MAG TPA: chemotaxis protein CheB [Solirubrobacteraceae bacterium]|nr:chemotaxis protein CheB [Solirubrobacteraceae bacterium]